MFKKITLILFFFALHLEAHIFDPCCIEAGAELLWWQPCVDDFSFAFTPSKSKNICPDWEPGIRVHLGECDLGVALSYTYLCPDTWRKIKGPMIFSPPSLISYTSAKGGWKAHYHALDVLYSHPCTCSCDCFEFKPFCGIQALYLDQKLKVKLSYPMGSLSNEWHSKCWGVGVKAGAENIWRLYDFLSIFSRVSGSLLTGDGRQALITGYHLKTGFLYHTYCCDCELDFRLGWEFVQWNHLPVQKIYINDHLPSYTSSPKLGRLGFHGLHFGMDLRY